MKEINKFELKNELVNTLNEIEKLMGKLESPACADDETGRMRSRVLSKMYNLTDVITDTIHEIY